MGGFGSGAMRGDWGLEAAGDELTANLDIDTETILVEYHDI